MKPWALDRTKQSYKGNRKGLKEDWNEMCKEEQEEKQNTEELD